MFQENNSYAFVKLIKKERSGPHFLQKTIPLIYLHYLKITVMNLKFFQSRTENR